MTTEKEKEKEKDPYAGLKALIYEQKPETREAEIRAQKGRAKATAWLQAFTSLADAFTLGNGGDVVKRDMNPYILNNMQRADALGEQDRADKKAWENSLLNLENNIAQYSARQIEADRQRKFQEAFQQKQADDAHAKRKELMDEELEHWKIKDSITSQRVRDKYEAQFRQAEKLMNIKGENTVEAARIKSNADIIRENIKAQGKYVADKLKSTQPATPYMSIPNPYNRTEMIGIDESTASLLYGLAVSDTDIGQEIYALLQAKSDQKAVIANIASKYPEKIKEYLGAMAPRILGAQVATPTTPTTPVQNPWVLPGQTQQNQSLYTPNAPYAPEQTSDEDFKLL